MSSKKTLPIVIIGLAILVLIPIAYYAFRTPQSSYTNQTSPSTNSQQQLPGSSPGNPSGTGTTTPQSSKPVSSKDPATLVPDGTTLDQYCNKYYSAWKSGDWQTAFDMQPLSKKNGSTVNSFASDRTSYGKITGYKVGKPQINGNVGTVTAQLDLGSNGVWITNWTFVKNDKGQWTVQNSTTSMGR